MAISKSTVKVFNIGNCEFTVFIPDKPTKESPRTNVHYHLYFEVHFISKGKCLINHSDGKIVATQKDTVIIPPNYVHGVTGFKNCERFCIFFLLRKTNVNDIESTYDNIFSNINALKDPLVLKKNYVQNILQIMKCSNDTNIYKAASTKHLLSLLFLDIANNISSQSLFNKSDEKVIDNDFYRAMVIEGYINLHFNNPKVSLTELSSLLYLSTKQTERIVKRITGLNFKQLILKQRMHVSMEMIKTDNLKMYEIAQSVGYNSYAVFYKAFVKYFGKSPYEFKN